MGKKRKSSSGEGPPNPPVDTASPMEIVKKEQHKETSGSSSAKRNAGKNMNVVRRRSSRLQNASPSGPIKDVALEEIDLIESDGQEDNHVVEEPQRTDELNSEPSSSHGNMEAKIDFLVQSAKKSEQVNFTELYIDSRIKIDSLTKENQELTKKLEFARGKVEAFEQMKDFFGNPNLAKAIEALVNISSPAGTAARCNLPVVSPTASPRRPPAAVGAPCINYSNGNLPSPTPGANADENMSSPEKSQRGKKKLK